MDPSFMNAACQWIIGTRAINWCTLSELAFEGLVSAGVVLLTFYISKWLADKNWARTTVARLESDIDDLLIQETKMEIELQGAERANPGMVNPLKEALRTLEDMRKAKQEELAKAKGQTPDTKT